MDKKSKSGKRVRESNEEREARKEINAKNMMVKRASNIPISNYSARNAKMIFEGKQIVPELEHTPENIGRMSSNCCEYCKAKKWKNEPPTVCCSKGKVQLPLFPDPPKMITNLLKADTVEGKLFRQNTRTFNNALALSSLQVQVRSFAGGYTPCIVFEGKVCQRIGPLLPDEGNDPKFAQLYVHDPATEKTVRIRNMNLPQSLNKKEIEMMENVEGSKPFCKRYNAHL